MSKSTAPAPSLADHPRRNDLADLVRTLALSAADERSGRLGDGLEELMAEAKLSVADGQLSDEVNVLEALLRIAELGERAELSEAEQERLSRLLAAGIALSPPEDQAQADRLAAQICWLAAHTFLDVGRLLDDALGADAERIWTALGNLVREADGRRGRAEALVALSALRASTASGAQAARQVLSDQLRDPTLRELAQLSAAPATGEAPADAVGVSQPRAAVVGDTDAERTDAAPAAPAPAPAAPAPAATAADDDDDDATLPRSSGIDAPRSKEDAHLQGELVSAPLGPVLFALGAVSGILVLRWLLRFVSRVLLRSKRPAQLTVQAAGITIDSSWSLLGRKLGSSQTHIPFTNLARAVREVRYPRLATYVGLVALALGTFVGVSLFTDGGRSGSPSLLALGAAVFGGGVLIELASSSVLPSRQGKHRLVFVPRRGRTIALSTEDAAAADAALRVLATQSAPRSWPAES